MWSDLEVEKLLFLWYTGFQTTRFFGNYCFSYPVIWMISVMSRPEPAQPWCSVTEYFTNNWHDMSLETLKELEAGFQFFVSSFEQDILIGCESITFLIKKIFVPFFIHFLFNLRATPVIQNLNFRLTTISPDQI